MASTRTKRRLPEGDEEVPSTKRQKGLSTSHIEQDGNDAKHSPGEQDASTQSSPGEQPLASVLNEPPKPPANQEDSANLTPPQKKFSSAQTNSCISAKHKEDVSSNGLQEKAGTSQPATSRHIKSHDQGTQSSDGDQSVGSDPSTSSTQPTSQGSSTDASLAKTDKIDRNKLPRIPKKPVNNETHRPPKRPVNNKTTRPPKRPINNETPRAPSRPAEDEASVPPKKPEDEAPRPPKRPAEDEAPRPRKRPGAGARVDKARSDAVLEKRKREEEQETLKVTQSRGGDEFVRQHYNLVPQRGRDWRNSESKIKGLRKYNNWVKSVIINRFSQSDDRDVSFLKVLDMGCGKGGDLQKWHSTPQPVELYVGIDPAEISIDQAKDRYAEMRRGGGRGGRGGRGGWRGGRQQAPLFEAVFVAKDAFGHPVADIPVVQHVGFDSAGNSRWGGGGFDVVSMMFCMHYAFESEAKARGMLANVAGSLKKGGRFIGVIPNSDVIRSNVADFHARRKKQEARTSSEAPSTKPLQNGGGDVLPSTGSDLQVVEPMNHFHTADQNDIARDGAKVDGQVELHPPKPHDGKQLNGETKEPAQNGGKDHSEAAANATAEWGNEIYRVRFPGQTPEDGIFRPPFGWKYNYFLEEAVEEVPEYVVPWEAFRA